MRRILAMSMVATVPAILPAVAAGAQSRPTPPSAWTHHRLSHRLPAHDRRRDQPGPSAAAAASAPDAAAGRSETARPGVQLLPLGSPAQVTPAPVTPAPVRPAPVTPAAATSATVSAPAAPTAPARTTDAAPGQGPGAAQAPAPAADDYGNAATRLVLKTAMGSATPHTVTLLCDPPGGTHPKAAQACADIARSHGGFTLRSSGRKPRACFMIYSPVTVSAEGRWRGKNVRFTARFPNTCVMHGQTGAIFDF